MSESDRAAVLVAGIEDATRRMDALGASRSVMISELVLLRVGNEADDPRAFWACDGWDSTAAEIGAAMNISSRQASGQMRIAEALREHLPAVFALYQAGRLSSRVIAAITWRTRLITDEDVWVRIDTAISQQAERWGPLADVKLTAAVDALVHRFDPAAVIESRTEMRGRDFQIGYVDDEAGVASVWGTLSAADGEVFAKKRAAVMATVCENDPRSAGELRSDAAGAVVDGRHRLVCGCGSPACPAAGMPTPSSSVVVNVIADQAAVDAAREFLTPTEPAEPAQPAEPTEPTEPTEPAEPEPAEPEPTQPAQPAKPAQPAEPAQPAQPAEPEPTEQAEPESRSDMGTAILSGTVLPTPMLAELLRNGAKLQPLCTPDEEPEPRYRPSAKLARFVRSRDLTCRFPGCTAPAERCDIDHVIPYPIGGTHAGNLACLCRKHHLLKTFWVGDWALMLLPDGVAVWTSPTGRTYTTHPGCRMFFPDWDTTTNAPPVGPPRPADFTPTAKVPTRKRTRSADRAARINAERAQSDSDPPPF